ncbi:YitT family protein [Lapidilactobacillus mulanensis]|uniref:YitT family protein n=1 Tax=Lapidilactobacillus mulanensis TaxID=2485999 RepID=A0ABW4DNS3_9LACO|nr:YitT family protein [Lapidilactobacillus mulanensis]
MQNTEWKSIDWRTTIREFLMITIGALTYGFGLVAVNIKNNLAEGGMTGVTLILRAWWNFDPAYSTLILNIPLIILGYHFLGRKGMIYTIYGTLALSASLWIWQRVPFAQTLNLHHDLFIAGVLAGIFGGFGSGLIYRFGGTTGGSDVVARILELERGIPMGKTLLAIDVIVLLTSLTYLDIEHMMYTLLSSFVFSRIVDATQDGSYSAKGLLIISDQNEAIAQQLMDQLERGATFLTAEGAYQHDKRPIVYCVVAPSEVVQAKKIIIGLDSQAFVSIIEVHEAVGEGFTYLRKPTRNLLSIHRRQH